MRVVDGIGFYLVANFARVAQRFRQVGENGVVNGTTEAPQGVDEVKVLNQSGTELPSTGGMGTTIFYVLGSILVVGAAVLLVTRKRMSTKG